MRRINEAMWSFVSDYGGAMFYSSLRFSPGVAMEACAGSHYWGREILRLGHDVRLIPPSYVEPFVKRQKSDAADAEAICEASQRATMRFVQVKANHPRPRRSCSGPAIFSCASAPSYQCTARPFS
jgi:transposase